MNWQKFIGCFFIYFVLSPGLWLLVIAAAVAIVRILPHVEWFWT